MLALLLHRLPKAHQAPAKMTPRDTAPDQPSPQGVRATQAVYCEGVDEGPRPALWKCRPDDR